MTWASNVACSYVAVTEFLAVVASFIGTVDQLAITIVTDVVMGLLVLNSSFQQYSGCLSQSDSSSWTTITELTKITCKIWILALSITQHYAECCMITSCGIVHKLC